MWIVKVILCTVAAFGMSASSVLHFGHGEHMEAIVSMAVALFWAHSATASTIVDEWLGVRS